MFYFEKQNNEVNLLHGKNAGTLLTRQGPVSRKTR